MKPTERDGWYGLSLRLANEIGGRELFCQTVEEMSRLVTLEEYREYAEKLEERYEEWVEAVQSFDGWEERQEERRLRDGERQREV